MFKIINFIKSIGSNVTGSQSIGSQSIGLYKQIIGSYLTGLYKKVSGSYLLINLYTLFIQLGKDLILIIRCCVAGIKNDGRILPVIFLALTIITILILLELK